MIVPYASDEENDRSRDDADLTIIIDKEIKIETGDVSEDQVKTDNLFAFDVNFIFNLGNLYKIIQRKYK